mgnify:CR=1 FL=1
MGTHARGVVWAWGLVLFALVVNPRTEAATWFVKTNGNDAAPGTNWASAKQTIQAAVDAAAASDTVLVSNGVYPTGGRVASGFALTNRVVIDKPLTVHSITGPAFTTIRGRGPLGHAAMHCVWMTNGATVASFNPTPDRGAAALAGIERLRKGNL